MRQLRYRLKKEYWDKIENLIHEEAYKLKPENILEKSWKDLVDRWFDAHFQVLKLTLPSKHHIHYATWSTIIFIFFLGNVSEESE
jgi:hypothetical protein